MQQRSAELIGLALGLLGLALLVALACYDPRDPSLNTATSRHTSNLAGPVGAVLADLLLQGFGVAGALPGLAMLTWAWRIASRRGLGSMAARLAALLAALPVLAAVLAGIAAPAVVRLADGGRAGRRDRPAAGRRRPGGGREVLGPFGALLVWTIGAGARGDADAAGAGTVRRRMARRRTLRRTCRALWRVWRTRCRRAAGTAVARRGWVRLPRLPRLFRRHAQPDAGRDRAARTGRRDPPGAADGRAASRRRSSRTTRPAAPLRDARARRACRCTRRAGASRRCRC